MRVKSSVKPLANKIAIVHVRKATKAGVTTLGHYGDVFLARDTVFKDCHDRRALNPKNWEVVDNQRVYRTPNAVYVTTRHWLIAPKLTQGG